MACFVFFSLYEPLEHVQHSIRAYTMDSLQARAKRLLEYISRLQERGIHAIIESVNANRERGVYCIEVSSLECDALESNIKKDSNVGALVDCIRFHSIPSTRFKTVSETVCDMTFDDATHTSNPAETLVFVAWVYAGSNAKENPRDADDFGVQWAALTSTGGETRLL
jgi:hypothetical protein